MQCPDYIGVPHGYEAYHCRNVVRGLSLVLEN